MNDDLMQTGRIRAHSIVINARERAIVTGVNDVESFNENEVVLLTDAGVLTIIGDDMHISKLNLEDGQLIIDGAIDGMDYGEQNVKKPFMSKLFR